MKNVTNSVTLIGNLGSDPIIKKVGNSENAFTYFSLATNHYYNDSKGNRVTETQWHRCVAFGKTAEKLGQFLSKGHRVAVNGQLKYTTFKDKSGQEQTRAQIQVTDFFLIEKKAVQAA